LKKFVTIFILFIYLLFNAGIGYSLHYCGSQLTSSLAPPKEKCACPNTPDADDCCSEVSVDEQELAQSLKLPVGKVSLAQVNFLRHEMEKLFGQLYFTTSFSQYFHPPHPKVPTFIFLQVFRL
jgi:hypothetical protein